MKTALKCIVSVVGGFGIVALATYLISKVDKY